MPCEPDGGLERPTFATEQVATLLSITPAIIMNHRHLNGLDFCSETPGRGRSREFCTLDIYMLALVREIVALTGDANRAAGDVNQLVYADDKKRLLPPGRRAPRKRQLRENIGLAHELFRHRRPFRSRPFGHHFRDWFLLREDADEDFRPKRYAPSGANYREGEFSDALYHGVIARRRVSCFNATMILTQVDERLSKLVSDGVAA